MQPCVGVGMSVAPGGVAAAGEAISAALKQAGGPVDTVLLFASSQHADPRPLVAFAKRARPLLDDLPRAAQTLFVAIPCDGTGDFVVRGISRFDPERGLLALSEAVPVGAKVCFALREPVGARDDLRRALERVRRRLDGRPPRLGFYFNCAGRGRGLFGVPDHDVAHIQGTLGAFPLVGVFGGGEIGPAGGRSRLHLFSGVLAVVA